MKIGPTQLSLTRFLTREHHRVHLIGVAGSGMSGVAALLLELGHQVGKSARLLDAAQHLLDHLLHQRPQCQLGSTATRVPTGSHAAVSITPAVFATSFPPRNSSSAGMPDTPSSALVRCSSSAFSDGDRRTRRACSRRPSSP